MKHDPNLPNPIEVIPYKPPHLWLDGIIEVTETSAKGFWKPGDEHFDGHFDKEFFARLGLNLDEEDDFRVLMGHKQAEAASQLGAYAFFYNMRLPRAVLLGESSEKFHAPVLPGSTLELSVEMTEMSKRRFSGLGQVAVNGIITSTTTMTGDIASIGALRRMFRTVRNSPAES